MRIKRTISSTCTARTPTISSSFQTVESVLLKAMTTSLSRASPGAPLEIDVELAPIDLPIAAFPPFKLRSSMVDTDPVIWVHLIEVFVQYAQTIIALTTPLTERSEQQLCLFVKSYLHEIAEEQGQLLSLGLINVQITENLETLRCWMFELVKKLGSRRLKLNGESVWDFAKIYALKNSQSVALFIAGKVKPLGSKHATSEISQVQKHLEHKITNGKFDKYDIQVFAVLISNTKDAQKSNQSGQKNGKVVQRSKGGRGQQQLPFHDEFLTLGWFEMLEKLYSKGEGLFASLCKDLAVLSLVSASTSRVAALATELGISSYHALGLYPLFAAIVTSLQYKKLNPGLETKLPFLGTSSKPKVEVNQDDVQSLIELFPMLTITHTENLLRKHSNNVERVTMLLLESPEAAIEPEESDQSSKKSKGRHVNSSIPTADSIVTKKLIGQKQRHEANHVPDEAKNKTLEAALRLMYEDDEDEHDDTYDEAEATIGAQSGEQSKIDKIEKYLWEIFKKDPGALDQSARKSRKRKEMKDETKWSDEQIEGWARMIQKSPKRAKILEEKYMFRGNKPQRTIRREEDMEAEEERNTSRPAPQGDQRTKNKSDQNVQSGQNGKSNAAPDKRQAARNEKNKASRANHNRKSGHDKKMAKGM